MLAERLKQLRAEKGMTQVQLAQMLDVSKGTVAMWETSKRKPSFEILSRLSDIFDRRMDYILGYSDDASSPQPPEEELDQLGCWAAEDTKQSCSIFDWTNMENRPSTRSSAQNLNGAKRRKACFLPATSSLIFASENNNRST